MTGFAEIVVSQSTVADLPAWRQLAREVEREFGAPMAESEDWIAGLQRHLEDGTAWAARPSSGDPMVGGMWLCHGRETVSIHWLAVQREHRRHGIGSALVEAALTEASGRSVYVVTFGDGHPMEAEARAARELYQRLGFESSTKTPPDGPDGTPRAGFWHRSRR